MEILNGKGVAPQDVKEARDAHVNRQVAGVFGGWIKRAFGVEGEEAAYSDSYPAVTYEPGSGTGLKGSYTANYTKGYRADEALALVQTNATLDVTWASGTPLIPNVASSVSNVLIVWSGKLIVPHAGAYTFYATSDAGAALRLDGQFVINDWVGHTVSTSAGTVTLAAGQHDIRVDYFQGAGGAGAMRL